MYWVFEVWNLTLAMLGKRKSPELKAKAGETVGMLQFTVELLQKYRNQLQSIENCDYLIAAGKAALNVNDSMKRGSRVLTEVERECLLSEYLRHVSLYLQAGGKSTPKHHLCVHMIQRSSRLGNPKYYHTYRDETLNGLVAKLARAAHRWVFHTCVHRRYAWLRECRSKCNRK